MIEKSIIILLIASALFLFCSQNPSSAPENITYELPKSTLNAKGIDTTKFNEVVKYIERTANGIRSITIIKNGKLVFEKYYHIYNIDTTYYLWSTTKSVMGVLTGIAIQEDLIKDGLKAKVVDFFPEIQFENLSDDKKKMTIEDILTLRTGLQWDDNTDDFFDNPDPVKFILDKPMDTVPGTAWNYNSGAPHLLSAIISKVSGKSTLEFAKENLFDPLGIKVYDWEMDSRGIFIGGYGLSLKPKDLAKVGLLYLNKGKWNGKEIVSEDWVKACTDSITPTAWPENGSMGYLWWVNYFGGYSTRGAYGQNMYVFPDKDLIIVFTSNLPVTTADRMLNIVVKDHILPVIN
jgi:CubicO group peptidase (beta-lactamase class C family)